MVIFLTQQYCSATDLKVIWWLSLLHIGLLCRIVCVCTIQFSVWRKVNWKISASHAPNTSAPDGDKKIWSKRLTSLAPSPSMGNNTHPPTHTHTHTPQMEKGIPLHLLSTALNISWLIFLSSFWFNCLTLLSCSELCWISFCFYNDFIVFTFF